MVECLVGMELFVFEGEIVFIIGIMVCCVLFEEVWFYVGWVIVLNDLGLYDLCVNDKGLNV